ncbi:Lipid II flippase FtsW [Corynebacterium kalinowskii]|uniref:Probable peptidoglycan glycosyltransferase FtsW n=1 Tax=Corynebacterium kalinowskii TaxID=2675216 RepID=A0A6B8VWR4_9CORY|nr:putative peptidoglycan glycosyltransferase FtsW [Corynebacterium kalinowskii]QGU01720.1 Lipid II flippase FtsW [Corynebacterium kalinowskii]
MTAPKATPREGVWQKITGVIADLHSRPLTNYTMIMISVSMLTVLGVVMVFSSSMATSVVDGSSVWSIASRQAFMVVVGLVAMWVAMRIRPATIRRFAPWFMAVAIVLLIAVLIPGIGTGREEVGSQSWIAFGPIRFQPSEFAKVAIAIWGASFLGVSDEMIKANKRFSIFIVVAAFMTLLIIAEGDVGMAMTFLLMVAVVLFFAGVDLKVIIGAAGLALLGLVAIMLGSGFRSQRFTVYFDALFGRFHDTRASSFQSYQGFLSLADGSATGVGLGQSRAKWFYLPEAKNDFIFAIIGEELGLWGGALVIATFLCLAYYGIRCALQSHNKYMSLLAASLTMGVIVQAFINIGYVIGLLPVTGIQLPMLSAGGTSAIITLGSMGLLASCARYEPEAISAMQSYGRPFVDQVLRLKEPDLADIEQPRPSRPRTKQAPRREPVVGRNAERRAEPRDGADGSVDRRSEKRRQSLRQQSRTRQTPPTAGGRPERRRNS